MPKDKLDQNDVKLALEQAFKLRNKEITAAQVIANLHEHSCIVNCNRTFHLMMELVLDQLV